SGPARGRAGGPGQDRSQPRKNLRELDRSRPELAAQPLGIRLPNVAAERLHPRPVGRRAARLPAAPDEDLGTAYARVANQLVGQTALADPRLADEEEEASPAGNRVVQARVELGELALAADEDPACRLGNRLRQRRGVERRVLAETRLLRLAAPPAGLRAEPL